MIKKLVSRVLFPNTCDNDHFVKYLRKNGAIIGSNTRFIYPKKCSIDPGRLDYISIGDNCCLSVVSIIAHDYSWYVFGEAYNEILPDAGGRVVIGNNCFIGYQACILKDTVIGDNVIIGARSVVKGVIPSNTIWAGVPAKQIATLDTMYQKRKTNEIEEAKKRINHIRSVKGRDPLIEELGFFCFMFLDRTEENYKKYILPLEFNGNTESELIKRLFFSSKPGLTFEELLSQE